jgi:heme-degrading monooxygenase HmoA
MEQEPDRLYARTWRLRVDSVPQQEAIQMMLDVLLPEVSSLPGYRGATLLMDRTTSELNATVYWASLADLSASQVRETNAATGAFVLADGSQLEAAVHDVVLVDPAPALVNRSLGSQ